MPVTIERPALADTRISDIRERRHRRGTIRDSGRRLTIALVNNMPDSALEATETQFTRLLRAAAGALPVQLRFYYLPEIRRGAAARVAGGG